MSVVALYVLVDDRGNVIAEYDERAEALRVLDEEIACDPTAADELAVIALDAQGLRVGEPISGPRPRRTHGEWVPVGEWLSQKSQAGGHSGGGA